MMAESDKSTSAASTHRAFRRRKQLERDLEHVTGEMYRRNRELAETNQMLSLLRTIDTMVLESQESLKLVSSQITRAITDTTDYPLVAILARPSAAHDTLELYGWSAKNQALPDNPFGIKGIPKLHLEEAWLDSPQTSKLIAISDVDLSTIKQLFSCSEAVARSIKEQLPIKSLYILKLIVRGRLVGAMAAGFFAESSNLTPHDTQLFDRLGEAVGIAVDNRLLFEENRRVVLQLQHSNIKLKALDETKDDFISMASHQLRTPLTSVKGYLSMVLDGDAGKLTVTERKMLTQAFISSQRMVYLISDLLNVSRLKTGKFIIDSQPVNLGELISGEIAQLKETAATRRVKLTFKKPANFPIVQLDETKIRQVIMNFIDNAIYYTPAGGHIQVVLEDRPSTIELKVIDDGIGVPRSEQYHLFTKFYRAGNARKARPDGTGLGLFMAKKVIMAQGGALLFESKEGKGSTFGFVFSKSKVGVNTSKA
jgi:signal transduction histidine kinase